MFQVSHINNLNQHELSRNTLLCIFDRIIGNSIAGKKYIFPLWKMHEFTQKQIEA